MAKLIVYSGDQVQRELPLEREPFFIGRALESDLAVMDHLVSRKHAKLGRDAGGGWKVEDLGSSNGVFVNDQKITVHVLRHGDRFRIGSATIEYHDEAQAAQAGQKTAKPGGLAIGFASAEEQPQGMSIMKSVADLRQDLNVSIFREREKAAKPEKAAKEGLHFLILYKLSQATSDPELPLEKLYDVALDNLVEALDPGVAAILLIDKATGELIPKASRDRRGKPGGPAGELKLSKSIVSKVVQDKVTFLTRDAMVDGRFAAGKSVAAMQIRSAICVPIYDASEVEGVVYVDNSSKPGAFGEDESKLVTAVGYQLAVAIKREAMLRQMKQEAVVRSNLERYNSPDVVEMILKHGGEMVLGVREADVSVLYSDIEGFTKMCEKLTPADVANLLNNYFEGATAAIFRNKGQVNKYIGDAIMAVFGAPIANPNHAADACKAGLEMQEFMREFRAARPGAEQFRTRIGINSGHAVAGNIGASRRMEYTVIGSTVNVAARLEPQAPPDGVCIGPWTLEKIQGQGFTVQSMGTRKLKNVTGEPELFQVMSYTPPG